jgi:hypothetical protein
MTSEQQLREKLRKISALFEGATTVGERRAAVAAIERVRQALDAIQKTERPVEFQFTLPDRWQRRLFAALCRRYGLEPYRYKRQRHTTVMVRVPKSFAETTLWPEYQEIKAALDESSGLSARRCMATPATRPNGRGERRTKARRQACKNCDPSGAMPPSWKQPSLNCPGESGILSLGFAEMKGKMFLAGRRFVVVALLAPCGLLAADATPKSPVQATASLPAWTDISAQSGVAFKNDPSRTPQKYLLESMVGGVALFDYDGDGHLDIYFVNGAALQDPMPEKATPVKTGPRFWNRLYRGTGDGTFTDVTERAGVAGQGYGQGVAAGDYDNDGRPDLYLSNYGENILYRNNGDGTFSDVTAKAGVAGGGWSASGMFVDYDLDGHLDLIVSRYVHWDFAGNPWCGERKPGFRSYCHPDHFKEIAHLVFRNKGDGTFSDMTEKSGFAGAPGKGLGLAFNDFNRDGFPDILVANDSFPQQLFENKGDGTFNEVGLLSGVAYDEDGNTFAGMGIDFLDYDNDGWPDVFVNALAHQKYALFRNAQGTFEYVSGPAGISSITAMHSGWGAKFADFDNDGLKDLFVAQGHVMDNIELTQPDVNYEEPLLLMRNNGKRFEDVSKESGEPFQKPRAARGAAFGDLNNDGNLDIVVNCNEQSAVLLRNEGNGNHWLIVNTVGTKSNRDGIGARLKLVSESGREQYGLVSTASQRLEKVEANQILTVRESAE